MLLVLAAIAGATLLGGLIQVHRGTRRKHKHHNNSFQPMQAQALLVDDENDNDNWQQRVKEETRDLLRHAQTQAQSTVEESERRMRDVWKQLEASSSHASTSTVVWWNKTLSNEREWQNHCAKQLQRLGRHMQSTSSKDAQHFDAWWNATNTAERQWWRDTVKAYHAFEETAASRVWWSLTRVQEWTNHTRDTVTTKWFPSYSDKDDALLPLLYLNTTRARNALLTRRWGSFAATNLDYFRYYALDAQIDGASCGLATSAAILNSLLLTNNNNEQQHQRHYVTQESLRMDPCVTQHVSRYNATFNGIYHAPGGLNLLQVARLLQCQLDKRDYLITIVHVDTATLALDRMRREMIAALTSPTMRVLVNYHRAALGQPGGGHFSPVAAYSRHLDAFLVMDVAKYKYPPTWVPAARLYHAMNTVDACGSYDFPRAQDPLDATVNETDWANALRTLDCQERYRGYIIIAEQTNPV
jgi:hypothetical protein